MDYETVEPWAHVVAIYAAQLLICCLLALAGRYRASRSTWTSDEASAVFFFSLICIAFGFILPFGNGVQWIASYFAAMGFQRRRNLRASDAPPKEGS